MKKVTIFVLSMLTLTPYSFSLTSRSLPAIVSAQWLEQNLKNPKLVIVDIRSRELFDKSHIPGAIHAPFPDWVRHNEQRMLELPSEKEMSDLLGNLGISSDSLVVVVNKTDTDWNRSDATRVAWTCIISGIMNASVLDGGYNLWMKTGKPVTTDFSRPISKPYNGVADRSSLVLKPEVMNKVGRSILLDTRLPEDYFGAATDKGHIQSAVNLPAPWAFTPGGTFRDPDDLKAMALGVIGQNMRQEIILYCEVGGFASTWWFILSEVLQYPNVKLYDGSFQEWSIDPEAPVTLFRWN